MSKERWKDNIVKYYSKYLIPIIILFSLLTTVLSIIGYGFLEFDIVKTFKITSIYPYILFAFVIIFTIPLIIINTKSIDKKFKRNYIITIIIYFSLLFNIIATFDFYFIKSHFMFIYSIINLIINFPFYMILSMISLALLIPNTTVPETILMIILLFPQILISNIIFMLLFKIMKYKNNDKYIALTLYYIQNSFQLIIIMSFTYLATIG
jgi:hypothetical protein